MRKAVPFVAATLMLPAPVPAAPQHDGTIVVTGRSLSDTKRALDACLARKCPPKEDIAASLAHAENQFVAGDYRAARTTLSGSIGRNRRYARELPTEVAGLYRASGRISSHLGELTAFRTATLDMRDTLKHGLGKEDPRTLAADIEVADSRMKLGYPEEALDIYRRTQRRASALGLRQVEVMARIRTASLLSQMAAESRDPEAVARADAALASLKADARPEETNYRLAAAVLQGRFDRELGRPDRTQELIAAARAAGGATRPVLLSAEPIGLPDTSARTGADQQAGPGGGVPTSNVLSQMPSTSFEGRYADVGFTIDAEGRVSDVEVLRSAGRGTGWLDPVLASIRSRVYMPLARTAAEPEPRLYRVERYTLTSEVREVTGSRIAQHVAQPYVARLDLTEEPG